MVCSISVHGRMNFYCVSQFASQSLPAATLSHPLPSALPVCPCLQPLLTSPRPCFFHLPRHCHSHSIHQMPSDFSSLILVPATPFSPAITCFHNLTAPPICSPVSTSLISHLSYISFLFPCSFVSSSLLSCVLLCSCVTCAYLRYLCLPGLSLSS